MKKRVLSLISAFLMCLSLIPAAAFAAPKVSGTVMDTMSDSQELATPVMSLSNKVSTGKPVVKWTEVDGAESYEVYRRVGKKGTYKPFYTTTGTRVTNGSAEVGTAYYYKVRAISKDGTKSAFSGAKYRTCDCARPDVEMTIRSDGRPVLVWNKVKGAEKYEVQRSINGADYAFLSKVSGTKLTNSSAKDGDTYRYRVRALASRSAANSAWCYTNNITVEVQELGVPTLLIQNDPSTGKPVLQWMRVPGAVKYEIYRASGKNESFSHFYTASGTKVTNGSAKVGEAFYYKVRAVSEDGAKGKFSEAVRRICVLPSPDVTLTVRNGHPYLSWKRIPSAVNYDVSCSVDGGRFEELKRVKGTSLNHSSALSGYTYQYKVCARASRTVLSSAWHVTDTIDLP